MKVKQVRVGEVNNIYISRSEQDFLDHGFDIEIQKVIEKGHADGEGVTVEGVKTYQHFEAIVDTSKTGSAQYIFDKSGNRVKGNIVEYSNQTDGTVTSRIIRTTYRKYE